jgi:hypothetical protein
MAKLSDWKRTNNFRCRINLTLIPMNWKVEIGSKYDFRFSATAARKGRGDRRIEPDGLAWHSREEGTKRDDQGRREATLTLNHAAFS